MKNKSLVTIIMVSIVLFVGLVFAVYKIALKNDNEFYTDGYVSITDTDVSDKVYFAGGTVYKKGYNNEIVFKNVENVKSEVSKYSFVYYNNKSISYLNDGVLMALDELDTDYIPYYNIKNNYIISYENGHYVIKTKTKDISLDNFIGRIDENKYIVAGNNLKLKLASSDEPISNYYFEINFVEGNQVKIDNDKVNVKTIGEDNFIYVGNDVVIDLNNRIIKYKGDLKLNLSEITINSDTNIDIMYDSGKYNEVDDGNGGAGGNGGGNKEPEKYEPEKVVEYKNVPYVELLSSNVGASRIRLEYKVIDTFKLITGDVTVRYMNLATSEVNEVTCGSYDNLCVFDAQNLVSNTKYLVTILTSYVRSGVLHKDFIMFQRTFKTSDINLSLEREYVASDSIAYRVKMNSDSNFDRVTLNLYDSNGELVGSAEVPNNHQDAIVSFDDLSSNSTYTAKLENLVIGNVTFKSTDFGTSMNKTLKYNPMKDAAIVNTPSASSNKIDYTFSFDLGIGKDKDNAIKEVTYAIYDAETKELVKTIRKESTAPFTIEVGEEFSNDKKYVYQATLKINDNEKVVYQKTLVSNEFSLSNKVKPYSVFTKGEVTANTLAGSFKIYDADNTIDVTKEVKLEYADSEGIKGTPQILEYVDCGENESATTKCVDVYLEGLSSDNTYTLTLSSYVDLKDDPEKEGYIAPGPMQVGIVQVKTAIADIIYTSWTLNELELEELQSKVFDIDLQFSIDPEKTSELVVDNMTSFDMILYEGSDEHEVMIKSVHIESGVNIKQEYFNNSKKINLSSFGLTLNDLIARHMVDGSDVSQEYTIKLTNGKSGSNYVDFRKSSFVFEIDPTLLELTNDNATITVNLIRNGETEDENLHEENLPYSTFVAMEIIPDFESKSYVKSIDYVIYDLTDDNKKYSFKHTDLALDSESEIPTEILKVYKNGSEEFLKRGHSYQVTYTLSLDLNGDNVIDVVYPLSSDITKPNPVKSDVIDIAKQNPTFQVIPWTSGYDDVSETNSITYKYDIDDLDNALGDNPVVYYKIGTDKYTGDKTAICKKADKVSDSNNYQFNCVKLTNLNDKDEYTIFFEGKLYESSEYEIVPFNVGKFKYEAVMTPDAINDKIKFTSSAQTFNNLAVFKITDNTEDSYYVKRIANYNLTIECNPTEEYCSNLHNPKFIINNVNDGDLYSTGTALSFSSSNSITYKDDVIGTVTIDVNNEPNLASVAYISYCNGISGEKCLFIDYATLYNSVTNLKNDGSITLGSVFQQLKGHDLSVEVGFMYDTGKVGYYANFQKKYAFQIKDSDPIDIDGQVINDYYYIVTTNNSVTGSHYSFGALSGVYSYNPQNGGPNFVADNDGDSMEEYDSNGRTGEIKFKNTIYNTYYNGQIINNHTLNMGYKLSAKGVIINVGGNEFPILAKELAETTAVNKISFNYETVTPALAVSLSAPTINGIRLRLRTFGFAAGDVDSEDGKQYLYLEVYNKQNTKLQTLKINNDELISQTGKVQDKQYTLRTTSGGEFAEYKYFITQVRVNGIVVDDYKFDYINGVIKLKDQIKSGEEYITVTDGMDIYVSYNIAVYGLDINTDYYFKAYMNIHGNPTHLIDSTSKTYDEVKKDFKTLNISDSSVQLRDVHLDTKSLDDYATRYLVPNFVIGNDQGSEIIGFEDFIYEISYKGQTLNINPTQACQINEVDYHAILSNSCVQSTIYYSVNSYLDISNGQVTKGDEPFRFVFGTDYNLVIKAKIKTTTGYEYKEVFNGSKSVKSLEKPTVNVTKRSLFMNENSALRFTIDFNDPDHVLAGFNFAEGNQVVKTIGNGRYIAYLGKGTKRIRDSKLYTCYLLDPNDNSEQEDECSELLFNNLENAKDYYLILNYAIDTGNIDETEIIKEELRFPIYTLDESGVALGKVAYFASNANGKGISDLTFSYATNIMRAENEEMQQEQEAYVAGMVYDVSIFGGDSISEGTVFFIDESTSNLFPHNNDAIFSTIEYNENDNASSELGENYYEIILNHGEFPGTGASYIITFSFLLGSDRPEWDVQYHDQLSCTGAANDGDEPNGNYWDKANHKCYILGLEHEYSATFKTSNVGGE